MSLIFILSTKHWISLKRNTIRTKFQDYNSILLHYSKFQEWMSDGPNCCLASEQLLEAGWDSRQPRIFGLLSVWSSRFHCGELYWTSVHAVYNICTHHQYTQKLALICSVLFWPSHSLSCGINSRLQALSNMEIAVNILRKPWKNGQPTGETAGSRHALERLCKTCSSLTYEIISPWDYHRS